MENKGVSTLISFFEVIKSRKFLHSDFSQFQFRQAQLVSVFTNCLKALARLGALSLSAFLDLRMIMRLPAESFKERENGQKPESS